MLGRLWTRRPDLGRWPVIAIGVGLLLRLVWGLFAAGPAPSHLHDSAEYLRVAEELASFRSPTIAGVPSAYHRPGYPLLLVPLVWFSRLTGGAVDLPHLAALANALIGTTTIGATAVLARQWLGARAAAPAAWIVALHPPLILMSSTALADPLVTFMGVVTASLATAVTRDADRPAARALLGVGVVVGIGAMTRGNGILLVALPAALVWRHGWREVARTTLLVTGGVTVVLVPWAVRNQIEVGTAAPLSTGGASSLCFSHRDGANGLPDFSDAALRDCMGGSPYDVPSLYRDGDPYVVLGEESSEPQHLDEAEWYSRTTSNGMRWALDHPREELWMAGTKTYEVFSNTGGSIAAAEDSGSRITFSTGHRHAVQNLGDVWLWTTTFLAAVALLRLPGARVAVGLWLPPALLHVSIWGGVALDRYHQPLMPFLACLASAALVAARPSPHGQPADSPNPDPA